MRVVRSRVEDALQLVAPRYAVTVLPIERRTGPRIHGVLDTFTRSFTSGPLARTVAERTARDANRTYEGGGSVVDLIKRGEEVE